MSYEQPRTVTFNAAPHDEAQHRSARLGSRVIAGTLGIAAIALTDCGGVRLVDEFHHCQSAFNRNPGSARKKDPSEHPFVRPQRSPSFRPGPYIR
jgi:hypothetical protein